MKVMITGASGFLGSYIADNCLDEGDEVRTLVRTTSPLGYLRKYPGIQFCYGSLSDTESLEKATRGVDVVYHAAARSSDWGTYKMFEEANYIGTVNILNACQKNNVERLVYISSPSVVFDYKDEINISETYPYPKKFANHYSETKAKAEQLVLEANMPGGLTTVALRPHAIWGP
ncbi:MAG: NAD-dependent epimerase/dehydratase family protein, partial [Ignavibacteriales bacterium]